MASERRKRGAGNRTTTVLLILWASSCAGLQLDCGPGGEANEGSDHTLLCDGIQAGQNVYWIKKDSLVGDTAVANCSAPRICDNNFQTRYEVTRASDVTSNLKILGVTRGDHKVGGEWTCSSSSTTATCVVSVVYPPDIGSCEVRFDESSGQVLGECAMHKVYPKPTCNWFQQLQGGQATNISAYQTSLTSTQYVDASNSQIYFRATCHLHCPLPVTPGNYSYKVAITPGSVERQVTFTSTSIVSLPTSPRLSVSCPAGYVTDTEASSCTCMTSDLGSPSASLTWIDPDGNTVLSGATLTLALPFSSVTPAYNGRTYQCAVLHHTGESRVPYTPLIAVRPDINETTSGGYTSDGSENTTMTYIIVGSVLGIVVFFSVLFALFFCQKISTERLVKKYLAIGRISKMLKERKSVQGSNPTSPRLGLGAVPVASSPPPRHTKEHKKSTKNGTDKCQADTGGSGQPSGRPLPKPPSKV